MPSNLESGFSTSIEETGFSPRAPEDCRLYVIGDIHGRADLLRQLHEQILKDAASFLGRKVIITIGDYVDRGLQSFEVIEMLIQENLDGFENIYLKGNHEDFLIRFMEEGSQPKAWLTNGGVATLKSYNVNHFYSFLGRRGFEIIRQRLRKNMPQSHFDFLGRLVMFHREGDYLIVHAGVRPGISLEKQDDHDLLWIEDDFLNSDADFGYVVVHGHTIQPLPDIRFNRINIDTGAYRTNRLTCLVLEGDSRRFLHT